MGEEGPFAVCNNAKGLPPPEGRGHGQGAWTLGGRDTAQGNPLFLAEWVFVTQ